MTEESDAAAGPQDEERKPQEQSWQDWIENRIQEAQARGEFDNLPGKGKPLPEQRNPFLAGDKQLAFDLLRNSGHTLPWIADGKDIERRIAAARRRFKFEHDAYQRQRALEPPSQPTRAGEIWTRRQSAFAGEIAEINRMIDLYNLKVPSPHFHKLRLRLADELARLAVDHD